MRANRRLGQHFLRDADVLQEIVAAVDVERSAGVLEIGPGEGALTAFLVQAQRPVVTLDKDPRAIEEVRARFGSAVRAELGDALEVDLRALLPPADAEGRLPVVVGNLPYNAGSAIYRRLLDLRGHMARMVVMLQLEVAQRITAAPGRKAYGNLSVATALVANAWLIRQVPPQAFVPRPKVHSGLVLVEPAREPAVDGAQLEGVLDLVGRLFQSRRKTLANALGGTEALERAGLDPAARPETVSPEGFVALYRALSA